MLKTEETVLEAISEELYEYSKLDILPKVNKIKLSTNLLIFGLVVGVVLIILHFLI